MVSSLKCIAPCGQESPGDFHPGSPIRGQYIYSVCMIGYYDSEFYLILALKPVRRQTFGEKACHPERSEGSLRQAGEILRCAQDDRRDTSRVRSQEALSPNVYRAENLVYRRSYVCI